MTRHARQLAAAAAQYDHASEPEPDWAFDGRVDEIAAEITDDPERRGEAVGNTADRFRGVGYVEMIEALDNLARTPIDRLIGSDTLAEVLRLADSWRRSVDEEIQSMACDEAEKDRNDP